MIQSTAPALLNTSSDVKALLAEAGKSGVLVVSRRGLERADATGEALLETLRAVGSHADTCQGKGSREFFDDLSADDLGHAPSWIDAGSVYEELIAADTSQPAGYVFCLDPWAAQLIRDDDAQSGARWYFVSDLDSRKDLSHEGYWEQLAEWLARRPFAGIIAKEAWDDVLRSAPVAAAAEDRPPAIHLQKPGAWQWKTFSHSSGRPMAAEDVIVFLVKYGGSIPHLRVFLDSLARQEYPNEAVRTTILTPEHTRELETYLRWFGLAHPTLKIDTLVITDSGNAPWKGTLDRLLRSLPDALVVLGTDRAILPKTFARVSRDNSKKDPLPSISGVPMSAEASAHVITGNLDAVANYEALLTAFSSEAKASPSESLRLIPKALWKGGRDGPMAKITEHLRKSDATECRPGDLGILELRDLE
jgi:hypothetical protein